MPSDSTKSNNLSYQPQLDGLRAVCILFTIFNHIHGVPRWINGSVGVDIFFALSGFLITTLLLMEMGRTGTISLRGFYIRRFFRIVPLYVMAFLVTALAAVLIFNISHDKSKIEYLASSWPWILSFNRELCPDMTCGPTFFGHAWTIGVEEKFYIFWPIIALFALRRSTTVLVGLTIIIMAVVSTWMPTIMIRGYVGISFGCIAAIWHMHQGRELWNNIVWLSIMSVGYVISTFGDTAGNILISLGAAPLILSLVHRPNSLIATLLATKFLAWAGKLTYGLYLFHILVINFVVLGLDKLHVPSTSHSWLLVAVTSYALSILVAFGLYEALEKPAIRFGRTLVSAKSPASSAYKVGAPQ